MFRPKQLTLQYIYADCLDFFDNDQPKFLSLFNEHIDIDALIPSSFWSNFYKCVGRNRKYPLQAFVLALIIQRIFSIPTDSLLILFLKYSCELREFCGFEKVPDASKFTRFKQDFKDDLKTMFDSLVDLTEPICQEIDRDLASMVIFDTSGIEAYVRENNPKFINTLIKKLKSWQKTKNVPGYDPYKAAYGLMPTHAQAEPAVKQMYINGHFCYAYKFGTVVNGLGIVRDITFYDEAYLAAHPEIEVDFKSDSPNELKSLADSKALLPTLRDFYERHPLIKPHVFIGDSAFDSIEIYSQLLGEGGLGFNKAFIPLNPKSDPKYPDCPLNKDGVPCCPNDPSLPMVPETSKSHLRCGKPTFKFVCPKMKWVRGDDAKSRRRTSCENPCTDSPCGRMFYIYPEKALRAFPGTIRGNEKWDETYDKRMVVEKTISHLKDSFCVAGRKTQNALTSQADLLLSGIAQLVTVLLADRIHQRQYIRSVKPLIAV